MYKIIYCYFTLITTNKKKKKEKFLRIFVKNSFMHTSYQRHMINKKMNDL